MAREIYLYSGIYSWTAESFNREFEAASNEDVKLRVSSGGGQVFGAWPMIAKMNEHKGNIETSVDGLAASMALYLLPYSDKVTAVEVARFLIHRADAPIRNEEDRKLLADINKDLRAQFERKINSDKFKEVTGKSFDDIFNPEARIDVWLTANQAKKIGLVDEVVKLDSRVKAESMAMIDAIAATAGFTPEGKAEEEKNQNSINNKQKTQIMDIAKLKADHPGVYAQVIAEGVTKGVTQERDRVGAFMAFAGVDLEAVKKGIEGGEALTQTATAEFTVKMVQQGTIASLEEGSEDPLNTGNGKDKGDDKKTPEEIKAEKELQEYEASLDAELGIEAGEAS